MRKCFFTANRDLLAECMLKTCIVKSCAGSVKNNRFIFANQTPPSGESTGAPEGETPATQPSEPAQAQGTTPNPEPQQPAAKESEATPETTTAQPSGTDASDEVDIGEMRMETHGKLSEALREAILREGSSENKAMKERLDRIQKKIQDIDGAEKMADEETAKKIRAILDPLVKEGKITQRHADAIVSHDLGLGRRARQGFEMLIGSLGFGLPIINSKLTAGVMEACLKPFVKNGKITQEMVDKIMEHEFLNRRVSHNDPNVIEDFENLVEELGLPKMEDVPAIAAIRKLKEQQAENAAKFDMEMQKLIREFRDAMEECGSEIKSKMYRERTIRNLRIETGIEIREGQELRYNDEQIGEQIAIIKEIHFLGSDDPMIYVEFKNHNGEKLTGGTTTVGMSRSGFAKWIERDKVTENIDTFEQLVKSISFVDLESKISKKPEEGQKLEFEVLADTAGNTKIENAIISKIDKKAGTITLDTPVKIDSSSEPTDVLTFAEFAKWHKRCEVMKTIETVGELRDELLAFNAFLDTRYDRKPKDYPPIEVKAGEVLKYPDGRGLEFVIKAVEDKNIILSTKEGDKRLSFASFLRWVRKDEVQNRTAKSEAALATENIEDPKEIARIEKEKEEEIERARKEAEKDPGNRNLGSMDESSGHSVSYFRKLWVDTQLITPHNLYTMGKTVYDFIKRKMQRREHYAVGAVGERILGSVNEQLGDEFKSLSKNAENEEVELHAKHNRTIGVEEIKEDLHETTNRERVKAAIIVLCEKGQMRWDDPAFHDTLNKMIRKYGLVKKENIPVWVNEKNHIEAIETYLDEWFGADTFLGLRSKNDNAYKSARQGFEDQAIKLGSDAEKGGLKGALQRLLFKHLNGGYVNPTEYEEYIWYALEAGKMAFEDKIFFLMMGLGASSPGKHGHTLLHIDRMGAFEGKFMNNFPILDFFTENDIEQRDVNGDLIYEDHDKNGVPIPKKDRKPKIGKATIHDFRFWINTVLEKDLKENSGKILSEIEKPGDLKYGKHLTELVTETMAKSSGFRVRIAKSIKNASNWDVDDLDMHAPHLNEIEIEQIVRRQGGATMNVAPPGLLNALVGFNDFVKINHGILDKNLAEGSSEEAGKTVDEITTMILAFARLDAKLMNRYKKDDGNYGNLSTSDYEKYAGADSGKRVIDHVKELHKYIEKFTAALDAKVGGTELTKIWAIISNPNVGDDDVKITNAAVVDFRKHLEAAYAKLPNRTKDLAEIMRSVQHSGPGGSLLVRGKIGAKTKSEKVEEAE